MNPRIAADRVEVGRWLHGFATSHAKRESSRIEVRVETVESGEDHAYRLMLVLEEAAGPPAGSPPIELGYAEAVAGRTRLAWCAELAERVREAARRLAHPASGAGTRSA